MNNIKQALSNIIEGNLDEMRQNFTSALMEKAVQKLEERKIIIAESYFAQLDEQQLSAVQASQMSQGIGMMQKRPFGRPGFNMGGRTAETGTVSGNVPGVGPARITASTVNEPKTGYGQSTVSTTRVGSGAPIGTAKIDSQGARMTQIGARRVDEDKDMEDDDKNEREMSGPAVMPKKKMIARKMKKV
jgi:hypothetical protein